MFTANERTLPASICGMRGSHQPETMSDVDIARISRLCGVERPRPNDRAKHEMSMPSGATLEHFIVRLTANCRRRVMP